MLYPYVPGFLAFREAPAILPLLDELRTSLPHLVPDLLLVDGNGVHHPRKCGLASHLGVLANIPSIGCAKKFLSVGNLTRSDVEKMFLSSEKRVLRVVDDAACCIVALTGNSTAKPIYISPGHLVSLEVAAALVMMVTPCRVPEPIRQADLLSRKYIREAFDHGSTDCGERLTE
jgi:deoxyinosine 3'endonuclease (endonuclease V)